MKKRTVIICILIVAAFVTGGVYSGGKAGGSLENHIHAYYINGGMRRPLPVALVYAHENGVYADGIMMSTPLMDVLKRHYPDVPAVVAGNGPVYDVCQDGDYIEKLSVKASLYQPVENDFVYMKKENCDPVTQDELQPGDYLMQISISAARGDEYYSGVSFIHLVVPGGERSSWPLSTPTPTRIPTSTPTYSPVLPTPGN